MIYEEILKVKLMILREWQEKKSLALGLQQIVGQ